MESPHVCERFCPYRGHCDHGQKFAADGIRKERQRRPGWVYKKARAEAAAKKAQMEQLGIVQAGLPGFGKEPRSCGDCGQIMHWDLKGARGGRWVCGRCGND